MVAPAPAAAPPRPNVVLILADDLGYGDVGSFGCTDIRTPNIDSIGRQGIRFLQCYANAPECTPTRTALLTGRYQQRVGGMECAIGIGDVGRYDESEWLQKRGELGLPVSETCLARVLKQQGYDTACMGKWHLGYPEKFWPNRHGFDEFFGILGGSVDYFSHKEPDGVPRLYRNAKKVDRAGYMTDLIAEEANAWLKRRSSAKPFFLYVPFTAPHLPSQGPEDRNIPPDANTWNKGDRATYIKMVERLDDRVGSILAQLDRMGAAGNTLLIFVSDNGGTAIGRNSPLRGNKSQVWEGGIREPCAIRWPGVVAPGRITAQPIITMDFFPTILSAAGIAPPPDRELDGVDLVSFLSGKQAPFSRTLFWRYKRGTNIRKAVRDGDMKLVSDNGKEELHNLAEDEGERRDLLPQAEAVAGKLREKLEAWEKEVAAPRLRDFRAG
jgi:arylsulfatase A-like enzyme